MPSDLPDFARLECDIAPGVALWDLSSGLPRNDHKRRDRSQAIRALVTHHSGSLGAPGWKGARNSARYVVAHRGFPGPSYAFWLPHYECRDPSGKLILFRCNSDEERTYHTGGFNDESIAFGWQGNLRHTPPSAYQIELAEAAYPWAVGRYGLRRPEQVTLHRTAHEVGAKETSKDCPGDHVAAWVEKWRSDYFSEGSTGSGR